MNEHLRLRWARTATAVGWLLVFAYLSVLTGQIRSAFAITESSFQDGLFGARLERVSFAAFPQIAALVLLATASGALATVLVGAGGDRRELWISPLVRVAAGICYVIVAIAAVRIVVILTHSPDGVGDFGATLQQIGGILVASAGIRVSLEAERSAGHTDERF